MPVLLLVLGRTLLWIPADGGKTQGQRLPAAAVGGQRAGTCWGAWAWYLRLPRGAEGSWSVRAHQTGGPGTRRGSGLAGARSQRKSRTGCEEEHGIHRQQKWGAVGVSSQAAQVLSCPAQLSSAHKKKVADDCKEPSVAGTGLSCRAVYRRDARGLRRAWHDGLGREVRECWGSPCAVSVSLGAAESYTPGVRISGTLRTLSVGTGWKRPQDPLY